MKRLIAAALAAALLLGISGPVSAAKPASCDPTISGSPNPSVAGQIVTISASCLPAGTVTFHVDNAWTSTYTATGVVSFTWPYFAGVGTYRVEVYRARPFMLLASYDQIVGP